MAHTRYPTHRLDVPTLYAMLDERRGDLGMSWYVVGLQTGVSTGTFTRMKRPDASISASALLSLLVWLGRAGDLADLIISPQD